MPSIYDIYGISLFLKPRLIPRGTPTRMRFEGDIHIFGNENLTKFTPPKVTFSRASYVGAIICE